MKGPLHRSRNMVYRRWHCDACGRNRITRGDVTAQLCPSCNEGESPQPMWMKIHDEHERNVLGPRMSQLAGPAIPPEVEAEA